MSRFSASVSFLLAVIVLFILAVVTGEHSARTGSVKASPSAVASATRPADRSAARSSGRDSTPLPTPDTPRPRPNQTTDEKFQPQELSTQRRGVVYLTFDDGPSEYTPAILNILRATGSTATFFTVGFRHAKRPAAAAQVRAQGSNIGNHTYSHLDLTTLTPTQIQRELARGPQSKCVRPPFGATNPRVHRIVTQQGLREVLWTNDTLDWNRPGTSQIVTRATGPAVQAGSIVLMHDGGGDRSQTVAAVPKIISILQQRGFVIRRIPGC